MARNNSINAGFIATSFSSTLTWGGSTSGSLTFRLIKLGNLVNFYVPLIEFSVTSENAKITTNTAMPAEYRPITEISLLELGNNSGTLFDARVRILETGTIEISTNSGGNISGSLFIARFPCFSWILF